MNLRNNFKVGPTDWGWVVRVQKYYTLMGLGVGVNVANSTITEVNVGASIHCKHPILQYYIFSIIPRGCVMLNKCYTVL